MKKIFSLAYHRFVRGYSQLNYVLRHLLYRVKIKSFGHLSLYHILKIYTAGLINGTIAARAESIAYSFFMALFPAVVFIFSVIPYIPIDGLQETLMLTIEEAMPPHTWEVVGSTVTDIINIKRGGLLSISFIGVLIFTTNGVNGLIANFKTSYNKISMRPYFSQYAISMSLVFLLIFILVVTLALIITVNVFWSYLGQQEFLGIEVTSIIAVAKYFLLGFAILLCVSLIFYFGPKRRRLPFFSPGAILSTLLIVASSYVFAFYINHFAQYNKLYGSIGAILIFMFWLFINAFLLLLGFELNAAIVRSINHLKNRGR